MNITFRVTPYFPEREEVLFAALEYDRESQRFTNVEIQRLKDVVTLCEQSGAERFRVSSQIEVEQPDLVDISHFELSACCETALSTGAWEANLASIDSTELIEVGGWAPVRILRDLVYSTRLKVPRDIAYLGGEFVVSDRFLEVMKAIVPSVYGRPLFSGKRKDKLAEGVKQLDVDVFADPCPQVSSVAELYGYGGGDVRGGKLHHLGLPVLPESMLHNDYGIMRSSEPWYVDQQTGWIVTKMVGKSLALASREIELYPVLTQGTPLCDEHERFWEEVKAILGDGLDRKLGTRCSVSELRGYL
jgi:hypothetical protein